MLFSAKICYCIVKERLLKTFIHDILEEVALVTLSVSHLSKNLSVLADNSLDCIL